MPQCLPAGRPACPPVYQQRCPSERGRSMHASYPKHAVLLLGSRSISCCLYSTVRATMQSVQRRSCIRSKEEGGREDNILAKFCGRVSRRVASPRLASPRSLARCKAIKAGRELAAAGAGNFHFIVCVTEEKEKERERERKAWVRAGERKRKGGGEGGKCEREGEESAKERTNATRECTYITGSNKKALGRDLYLEFSS